MSKRLRFYFNGSKVAPGGAVVCTMSHTWTWGWGGVWERGSACGGCGERAPRSPQAEPPPHI